MGAPSRMKRRLLRQLVEENVAVVRGELPRRLRRPSPLPRALAVAGLALLPVVLTAVAMAAAGRLPWWSAAVHPLGTAAASLPGAAALRTGEPAPPAAGVPMPDRSRFAAPAPLDPAGLPLAVRTVLLDPGHGGDETGTRGPDGLVEKDLTLDIARRLAALLEQRSFTVLLTRGGDRTTSLEERARFAKVAQADILVSIHVNWIPDRRTRGVETYTLGPTDDPYLTRLAAAENANSGYSLADFRGLLDRIYADVRRDESRRLAESVQSAMYTALSRSNPELEDWGVKTAPFLVLVATEVPAVLAEVSCLSNQAEAELLHTDAYRQQIAAALCDGVTAYAGGRTAAAEGRERS